jgi:hypothetical protein
MYKRVVLTAAAMVACIVAGPPARATLTSQSIGDAYCLTSSGQIVRIPAGSSTASVEATIPNFSGEWLDFDPGSGEFVAGPDTSAIRNYVRLPMNLSSTGTDIPNTDALGGHGGAVDRFSGYPAQPADLLVADSNPFSPPSQIGVFRIKPNGTSSIAVSVGSTVVPADPAYPVSAAYPAGAPAYPAGSYLEPEDVEQDWSNGDIYVACSHTATRPGAILRFNKDGVLLDHYNMPPGIEPHCMVFDNRDAIPTFELIVATPSSPRKIYAIDIDAPAGPNRLVPLRDAPDGQDCTDLAISPSGKLIYPALTNGNVYQINLTAPYASSVLANVPGVFSVAFVSRNELASQDTGLTVGQFTPMAGPTGKPGVQVKVTDPEFSSGIVQIEVMGTNLVVYDKGVPKSLPYYFHIDERRELTQFTFIAEKINASAGASVQVVAHDVKGLCGDPIIATHPTDTGPPRVTHMDCDELEEYSPNATYRRIQITNGYLDDGVSKFTIDTSLGSISVSGDDKTPSGQTIDLRNALDKKGQLNGSAKIALQGITTILIPLVDWIEVQSNASASKPKDATIYLYID